METIQELRSRGATVEIRYPPFWKVWGIAMVEIQWPDNSMHIATCSPWHVGSVLRAALKLKELD